MKIDGFLFRKRTKSVEILDGLFFVGVQVFLTFVALHGKRIAIQILCKTDCSVNRVDYLMAAYNNVEGWLLMLVFPIFAQYLRKAELTLISIGFLGSLMGVIVCCFYLVYFDLKSAIIFFTLGFQYAIGVVVVAVDRILQFEHDSSFWELIFSTISKLVGIIIILYGAGSAILQFVSEGMGESIQGYLSSFLYPTVIIVGVLFMIGYWVLIPTLLKIHAIKRTKIVKLRHHRNNLSK